MIILDNSETPVYQRAIDELILLGFEREDFPGPGPYATRWWQTSFFRKAK